MRQVTREITVYVLEEEDVADANGEARVKGTLHKIGEELVDKIPGCTSAQVTIIDDPRRGDVKVAKINGVRVLVGEGVVIDPVAGTFGVPVHEITEQPKTAKKASKRQKKLFDEEE